MSDWLNPITRALNMEEMQHNALIIAQALVPEGWSINAVAAMLGNMEPESSINPGRWEGDTIGSGGFGLVQWTPASKLTNWIDSTYGSTDYANGDFQLGRIIWEFANGEQYGSTTAYPVTAAQFMVSELDPGYLAEAFLVNYEKPLEEYIPQQKVYRHARALYWYEFLTHSPWSRLDLILIRRGRRRGQFRL